MIGLRHRGDHNLLGMAIIFTVPKPLHARMKDSLQFQTQGQALSLEISRQGQVNPAAVWVCEDVEACNDCVRITY